MNRITTIEFPVFSDFIVHVEITSNIRAAIEKYPGIKHLADKSDDDCDAATLHTEGTICFLFLKPNVSVGTIAHESWHVIKYMFEVVSVDLDSETVAYHLGFIVDQVFKFLRRR